MTYRTMLAALAASGLLMLAGCVTTPQSDVAQAVKEALQPAVDAFFEGLDESLGQTPPSEETGLILEATGSVGSPPLTFDRYLALYPIPQWDEERAQESCAGNSGTTMDDCMNTLRAELDAIQAQAEADHETFNRHLSLGFHGWGYWARIDGEALFKTVIEGTKYPLRCPPEAECAPVLPPHAEISGTPTGTNPATGSAVWTGYTRAVDHGVIPITGLSRLEADLAEATIDVHLTNMGVYNHSWRDVQMIGGAFTSSTINGKFYGDNHEGVAGSFTLFDENVIGVFGALRE